MTNGRRKGAAAERDISKRLEAWWSTLEPGCKFVRTPLSGGWSQSEVRAGFKTSGDIMTTANRFPFAVEGKCRKAWSWKTFIAGKASPVWGWWKQAQAQALEMKAEPLLFFRGQRMPWSVIMDEEFARARGVELFYPGWVWKGPGPLLWGRTWYGGIEVDYGDREPALLDAEVLLATNPEQFAR